MFNEHFLAYPDKVWGSLTVYAINWALVSV